MWGAHLPRVIVEQRLRVASSGASERGR